MRCIASSHGWRWWLMLMSSPPPSIHGSAAPPFSPLIRADWQSRSILLLILPPPPSVSYWRTTECEQSSSLCAAAEAAPESLLIRRILHVWMRQEKGCCRLTKDKVTHTKSVCCGHSRRRNQRILALFWMGRGFSLCGHRVWIAEVRRSSSDLFFMARHRGTPW